MFQSSQSQKHQDSVTRGVSVKPVTNNTSDSVNRGVSVKPVTNNTSDNVTRGVSVKPVTNNTSDSVTRGVSVKPGECPVPQSGVTVRRCDSDGDCDGTLKCCTEGRGHVCRYPVYGEYGTRN